MTWQLHHVGTDISSVVITMSVASQLSPKRSDAACSCRGGVTMPWHASYECWCLNSRDLITAGILLGCLHDGKQTQAVKQIEGTLKQLLHTKVDHAARTV